MLNNKLITISLIILSLCTSSVYASPKRVIDQGMLDGQRRYIIACENGQQMFFVKKFTAPEQINAIDEKELPEPGEAVRSTSPEISEYIESCIETRDDRGDFCRDDVNWSARDAAIEYCN